jgi:hypothetical protein
MAVICVKVNGVINLTFEQRKWILKCYLKMENVTETQEALEKLILNTNTANVYKDA